MSVSSDQLAIAQRLILEPSGLDLARIDRALATVLGSAVDSADIYFQISRDE